MLLIYAWRCFFQRLKLIRLESPRCRFACIRLDQSRCPRSTWQQQQGTRTLLPARSGAPHLSSWGGSRRGGAEERSEFSSWCPTAVSLLRPWTEKQGGSSSCSVDTAPRHSLETVRPSASAAAAQLLTAPHRAARWRLLVSAGASRRLGRKVAAVYSRRSATVAAPRSKRLRNRPPEASLR